MLLVSESGSEKMSSVSYEKHSDFAARTSAGSLFHNVGYSRAKNATAVCSSSPWHLEQRSLWGA